MRREFRALVVDDDAFSRQTAVRILERLGAVAVAEAASGAEALHWVESNPDRVDLILCDLHMPELDGIETLEGLAMRCRSATFVLASGADARLLRAAAGTAIRFGISTLRVVSKPVTTAKMEEIVSALADLAAEPECPVSVPAAFPTFSAADISRGIHAGQFLTFYQPKVDVRSRRVQGAEALIRWRHPLFGLLPPAAFLDIAQANGLLGDLLQVGLACAGAHCAAWRRLGHDVGISVNLPLTALSSRDLPRILEDFVARYGLTPDVVTFEVTEDGWLQEQHLAREVLTRLRVRGFGLSIDDFGTRYSGVQQLLDAPFNEMKIDRAFIQSAPTDPEASIALASSIALARRLDMMVVAEGVETEAEWNMVADMGCDQVQGFLIARPMPAEQFKCWLAEQSVALSVSAAC